MALAFGSLTASKIYLGATEINLAYFGSTQVYSAGGAFSAEAQNYFDRLDTAGDTTYVDYKQPLANYIDSLVTLGGAYWDTMLSATSFVGVGIQGVTVPLRDGMTVPTNNNFVAGDLDQLTGIKGNDSTKSIDTGLVGTDLTLNDASWSCNITVAGGYSNVDYLMGSGLNEIGAMNFLSVNGVNMEARMQSQARTIIYTGSVLNKTGFLGVSRSSSAEFDWQFDSAGGTLTRASQAPQPTTSFDVFGASNFVDGDNRLATYHVGPALNLATLEGLQETLLSEIRTAHTFVAAASYFSRLAAAGDTAHVAYKQPLTNYITSLVELGGAYWDDMLTSASFVGVGIQGITVPLRDGMTALTNNNFVAGDLNQLIGLKSDGSTKYLDTGYIDSDLAQNNGSLSVYVDTPSSINGTFYAGTTSAGNTGTFLRKRVTNPQLNVHGFLVDVGTAIIDGLVGVSRTSSTSVNARTNQTNYSFTDTSTTPTSDALQIFAVQSTSISDPRLATYHAGPALDLATLEGLQDTLLAEIAGIGFSTEAANYFSRLAIAGDTTFLAYRQPLANYIDSLVALGGAYWDDMKSAASFVGVGIQGVTVPLRDGMPSITNNNFVAGDLNPLTGLKGDGSTKRIDALPNMSGFSQDDVSMSAYQTELLTDNWLAGSLNLYLRRASLSTTCFSAAQNGAFPALGLSGTSRSSSAGYTYRTNNINRAKTATSAAISDSVFSVVGWRGQFFSNGRVATYHVGAALDLATLEGLQDTLITEIAAI